MRLAAPKTVAAIVAALCWALVAAGAGATSVLPLDLDQMVAGAQHIVHVRCTANEVQADTNVRAVTVTRFVVLDRAKGKGGAAFTVRQAGGELDGVVVDYHVPKFRVGDEYVLFMPASSRIGLASPVGLAQGAFAVVASGAAKEVGNGRDFADLLPFADAAALPPGIAARLQRPRGERVRMDLGDFMTLIRAKAGGR
jgi:hypothetical protein